MFQRWGFLLGEMWVLLLLAALLGLLAGWLIWGRSSTGAADTGEADRLRTALDACATKGRDQAARITALEAEVKAANAKAQDAHLAAENARADAKAEAEAAARSAAQAASATAASAAPAAVMSAPASLMSAPVAKGDAAPLATSSDTPKAKAKAPAENAAAKAKADAKSEGASAAPKAADKPKALDKARDGKADDLKMIKGIGPKLEILCHKLGFFHFDQIAAWTTKEIAWVDDNLEGFKGRVTRDEWVKQAAILAKGGTTEFANRVKDGDVY